MNDTWRQHGPASSLKKKKWIGCTRKWHYIIAVVCLVIGLVSFFLAGIVNALFVVAIIFWLVSIMGCVGCCCILKKERTRRDVPRPPRRRRGPLLVV